MLPCTWMALSVKPKFRRFRYVVSWPCCCGVCHEAEHHSREFHFHAVQDPHPGNVAIHLWAESSTLLTKQIQSAHLLRCTVYLWLRITQEESLISGCLDQLDLWACLWGIVLIAFIIAGRPSLKVDRTILWAWVQDSIKGLHALTYSSLLLECRYNVNSYLRLLLPLTCLQW